MHWIDRGPAPDNLEEIKHNRTPGWILYFCECIGELPSDSDWRKYLDHLRAVFENLCVYCEEVCRGEVDHFRPKSLFPELVYEWSNWVLACHDCNQSKSNKWPALGYVNPCAEYEHERPDAFFTFDLSNGSIVPREGLEPIRHHQAAVMIRDLELNDLQHRKLRLEAVEKLVMAESFAAQSGVSQVKLREYYAALASRSRPLSSVVRVWLSTMGYDFPR